MIRQLNNIMYNMTDMDSYRSDLLNNGFSVIDNIYSISEVNSILAAIDNTDVTKDTFRKSNDLYAIRQFLKEVPETFDLIFTDNLKSIVRQILGSDFFVVKSIYFDKPASSNWYVPYHQDLTISVDKKLELENFGPWTSRPETIDWAEEKETTCCVQQGGIMLMKPLTLHSSSRTTNNKRRRVIHIEFSDKELPPEIQWSERIK